MRNLIGIILIAFIGCSERNQDAVKTTATIKQTTGKLIIIGGGKRPDTIIDPMIELASLKEKGYGIILPMSSAEPDSAIFYSKIQFTDRGLKNVIGMNFQKGDVPKTAQLDSIKNANLIYISGGDQNKFMDIIAGTGIKEAITKAYEQGAIIAGTSAGAAVMSKIMITGNEAKVADYDNTLRNIWSENVILSEGLGLVTTAVIDQHFIKRGRYNRLFSICIENPQLFGIGIDEATAILVDQDSATVLGESQVILVKNRDEKKLLLGDLLGANNLEVSVMLPGSKFSLK